MELLRSYSHSGTLYDLRKVAEVIEHDAGPLASDESNAISRVTERVLPLSYRLSDDDTAAIFAAWQAGTTQRQLAERYGVSHTSVKRIIQRAKQQAS